MNRRPAGVSRDWSVMLDSTSITTGLGLLSWVFVIRPSIGENGNTLLAQMTTVAYPVGDLVVLAMLVRLLLGGASKLPAIRFLLGAMLIQLLSDTLYVVYGQFGIEPTGYLAATTESVGLFAYVLIGAGALHPSVREIGQSPTPQTARLSKGLLAGLTLAALIAPAVLIAQALSGAVVDGIAIGVSSTALFILVVTRMAGLLKQLEGQSRQLRELARVDALTGLLNRRAWATELPLALERSRRNAASLSVAMLDLDFFKRFNDEYGHPAGDRLLKGVATAWRDKIRTADVLARYGGEEFIMVLPDADAEAAEIIERLRPVTPAGQTFSAGIATWSSDELVSRADAALYKAKHGGRNRTEVAAQKHAAVAAPPKVTIGVVGGG
jgi:diguanylate cyclase (GGDEF)-like protein